MAKHLYLYDPPFLIDDNRSNREEHFIDFFSPEDFDAQEKIHTLVMQFALHQHLIDHTEVGYQPSSSQDTGSWIWMMNWSNFRVMTNQAQYSDVIHVLSNSDKGNPINNIIDLHTRLGVLFDHRLLNTLVHRTIASISAIPPARTSDEDFTWEDIHRKTPFFWVLILLQTIMRSTTVPLE